MKLELVATCLFGLEHLLGEEIEALGYERISTIDGRITFAGDAEAVALSNIFLRYAERVFIKSAHRAKYERLPALLVYVCDSVCHGIVMMVE